MAAIRLLRLLINGTSRSVEAEPDTPLLWVLRDHLNLTGTKYGCGIGQCGACTVHVDDAPARACLTTIGSVAGKTITTIEGLSRARSHPWQPTWIALRQAWITEQVPQCGYCQPGMLMEATALLGRTSTVTDVEIDRVMGRHICRCGTYQRIRQALQRAVQAQGAQPATKTSGGGE
jgi:aerobic-type carbon monoxide dehydrogenase small subunit (CoxS/CutS family)